MFRKFVIRLLLSPFSLIYGTVISIINMFYQIGLLKASRFSIPVIGVGNLSIGGAGKTPHIEYLIELLKDYLDIALKGIVRWTVTLAPREEREFRVSYQVEYPSSLVLDVKRKQMQKRAAPPSPSPAAPARMDFEEKLIQIESAF